MDDRKSRRDIKEDKKETIELNVKDWEYHIIAVLLASIAASTILIMLKYLHSLGLMLQIGVFGTVLFFLTMRGLPDLIHFIRTKKQERGKNKNGKI
jgi:hypothetical protein